MKNYLLPIYHSKLKPWIKWWLLKQLELRSKTLSDWIEGTTPITITGAFKGKIQNLELEGNTSQTGTPTPEAPIPVRVVKGHNVIKINNTEYALDLTGKNLNSQGIRSGLYQISNGSYNSSTSYVTTNDLLPIPYGKTITVSTKLKRTANYAFYIVEYDENKQYLNQSTGPIWSNTSATFTIVNSNTRYIAVDIGSNATVESVGDIMVNEGETALPYEAYYDIEFCKFGDDYSDYILPDTNGYKIIKNVGKVVLNGSEYWINRTDITGLSNTSCFRSPYSTEVNNNALQNTPQISNRFECLNNTIDTEHLRYTGTTNYRFQVFINKTRLSSDDATGIKEWFSNNNTTVYYILSTPTYETITNTNLISQLDAIYNAEFKKGTNIITQTNSDLPFILHFKYYKKG